MGSYVVAIIHSNRFDAGRSSDFFGLKKMRVGDGASPGAQFGAARSSRRWVQSARLREHQLKLHLHAPAAGDVGLRGVVEALDPGIHGGQ